MTTYLKPEEVRLLETAASNFRDRLLIRLLFRTACRVSEVVRIAMDDLDLEAATIKVIRQKERLTLFCSGCGSRLGRSHCFCPGCGREVSATDRQLQESRRMRILPLDPDTVAMLRDFIARRGPVMKDGRQLVFGIGRGQAWRIVREAARRAGLGPLVHPESGKEHGVSPHRLRDAFAVNALKQDSSGEGMRLLQEHLGHVSFNTTARYRKVSGQEHREWYERLWRNSSGKNAPDVSEG